MADTVETLGVDLRTRVKNWSERKSEKEKVQSEILADQEEQGLPKELHEGRGQKVPTCGHDASKDLGSPRSGDGSHGEVEIENSTPHTSPFSRSQRARTMICDTTLAQSVGARHPIHVSCA